MRKMGLLVFVSWKIKHDRCCELRKRYFCAPELGILESFRATNELRKIAGSKFVLITARFEILHVKAFESRRMDQVDEVLQILSSPPI